MEISVTVYTGEIESKQSILRLIYAKKSGQIHQRTSSDQTQKRQSTRRKYENRQN